MPHGSIRTILHREPLGIDLVVLGCGDLSGRCLTGLMELLKPLCQFPHSGQVRFGGGQRRGSVGGGGLFGFHPAQRPHVRLFSGRPRPSDLRRFHDQLLIYQTGDGDAALG